MEVEKTCVVCGAVKPLEEFPQYKHRGSVLRRRACRACRLAKKRENYTPEQLHRAKRIEEQRELLKTDRRRCKRCGEIKDISEYRMVKNFPSGTCRSCEAAEMRERNDRSRTPEQRQRVELIRENRELKRYDVRRCKTCGEIKALGDFDRLTDDVYRWDCKACGKYTYGVVFMDTEIGFGAYRKCPSCGRFRAPYSFGEHEHCLGCRRSNHVEKKVTHETCKVCGETLPLISFKMFYDSEGNVQHSFVCDECAARKPRLSMASIRYGAKV